MAYLTIGDLKLGIGARLKEERLRLGFSQTDFAALVGAKKGTQISWEKDASSPTAAALAVFANAGVDVSYVLSGERGHANPKSLAEFENIAMISPVPSSLVRGLYEKRDENISDLRKSLAKNGILLSDIVLGQIVHVVEIFHIPVPQMANIITSIVMDVRDN